MARKKLSRNVRNETYAKSIFRFLSLKYGRFFTHNSWGIGDFDDFVFDSLQT